MPHFSRFLGEVGIFLESDMPLSTFTVPLSAAMRRNIEENLNRRLNA